MKYDTIKKNAYNANMALLRYGLVTFTWGNASQYDSEHKCFAIKPSGVSYDDLTPESMIVLDMSGTVLEGDLRPSSDMLTHLELYKAFPGIGGVVHTHSPYAVAWAQAGRDIPCYGTTHADSFYGSIPCIRHLTQAEIDSGYEKSTGKSIVERFQKDALIPIQMPGAICHSHGPFTWGKDAMQAVYYAVVLEEVAKTAVFTRQINANAACIPANILEKHFQRKHGINAYYGQNQ